MTPASQKLSIRRVLHNFARSQQIIREKEMVREEGIVLVDSSR